MSDTKAGSGKREAGIDGLVAESPSTREPLSLPGSRFPVPRSSRSRRLYDHSLVQLTLVRFREFLREPEAVFWVFIFPILLAAGLGIAFRNRPVEVQHVAIVSSAPGAEALAGVIRADHTIT